VINLSSSERYLDVVDYSEQRVIFKCYACNERFICTLMQLVNVKIRTVSE